MANINQESVERFLKEFDELATPGNIGFYGSCVMTNFVLKNKITNEHFNFFTRVSFQEKAITDAAVKYGPKKLALGSDFEMSVGTFEMPLTDPRMHLQKLFDSGWKDTTGFRNLQMQFDRCIPKQYSTSFPDRISSAFQISKNGDYLLELFDEQKKNTLSTYPYLTGQKFLDFAETAKQLTGIDISLITDKAGGIVYQFPVNILKLTHSFLPGWNGVSLKFDWHSKLQSAPNATIHMQAKIGKVYSGNACVEYNKSGEQQVDIGNMDANPELLIYSKHSNLIIGNVNCDCPRITNLQVEVVDDQMIRTFNNDQGPVQLQVSRITSPRPSGYDYTSYIRAHTYSAEKTLLEQQLSFKQYQTGTRDEALSDIRTLIERNYKSSVYLWDPYLRSVDVLNTLYYAKGFDTELRAIGSINKATNQVYQQKGQSVKHVIAQEHNILSNTNHVNLGLNLEFRMQHSGIGDAFHDRFLMFPGTFITPPKAYSLGTSINALGTAHHILQEVSYPQRVIDAFNTLWEKLDNQDCLVYKHP